MVARINSGKSIKGALNYNEQKVVQGRAQFLMAENYPVLKESLSYDQKLQVLKQQAALNERVATNCVHISLNFETNEKILPAVLNNIILDYMAQIGFGEQPFLVYRHLDAAHPHIHVVTTNIQSDGKRISLHNLGRERSEPAREEIELRYGLTRARGRGSDQQVQQELAALKPGAVVRASYGKEETKRAITQIVTLALQKYNVTSLSELNAVLNQFGITADRGHEGSNTYRNGGLLYRMIDEQGKPVGVPIKASKLYDMPTLKRLEKKFEKNKGYRKLLKARLSTQIDRVLRRYTQLTRKTLVSELKKQNIYLLFRENKHGITYGLTYVDHRNRSVFNGSELGKEYSAKAVLERLAQTDRKIETQGRQLEQRKGFTMNTGTTHFLKVPPPGPLLNALVNQQEPDTAPTVPRKRRKKKGEQEQSINF